MNRLAPTAMWGTLPDCPQPAHDNPVSLSPRSPARAVQYLSANARPLPWILSKTPVFAAIAFALCVIGLCVSGVWAQATVDEELPAIESATSDAGQEAATAIGFEDETAYTINTLIMFLTAVLVIFMQAGFAMLEVGLNAAKNAVNILFKNVMDFAIGVVLFLLVGYALMYPGDAYKGKWFGFSGTWGISRDSQQVDGTWSVPPTFSNGSPYASTSADFLFQVAFAATAATIVSGAVAGRMRFEAYLIYSAVMTAFIYPISGMWRWGHGALEAWGFQDFAGSVIVHGVGGFAGLAGAIALGPRLGRFTREGKSVAIPGHNLAFATLGVFILWIGWYGFNPGSQLTYAGAVNAETTTYIALTTTLSAATGTVVAMLTAWFLFGKPDLTMALNGALAGLVGITANCNQVTQAGALIIGAVAGILVVLGIIALDKLRIDDPVGAWPVHGLCGIWGGVATGLLGQNIPEGLTRAGYILVQVEATAIICAWSFGTMAALFYALKAIGLLRVSPQEEQAGLDISEHGMHAYPSSLVAASGSADYLPQTVSA